MPRAAVKDRPARAPSEGDALTLLERRIAGAEAAVLDVETEGLDWRHHRICGWVWNFGPRPEDGFYFPVRHKGTPVTPTGGNFDPRKVRGVVQSGIRQNPRIRIVGHNLHFDLKFLAAEGIDINQFEEPFEDTQINAFLLNEYARSFSLDAQCREMGVQEKKGDELYAHLAAKFGGKAERSQMANYHRLPPDDPIGVDYALGDGISTWELCEAQQPRLDEEELRQIWMIERRCIRVLARMSIRGIRVDEERLGYVMQLVQRGIDKARAMLPDSFNPRSPKAMRDLLARHGITGGWPTTPKGAPSFTKDWLLTTEVGRAVVGMRELEHLNNSFLMPLHGRHLWRGRVHTTYNQTRGEEFGTVTGRLSSSDPNLQQIHKRNELLGPVFRSIFIPDDGMTMATADYNQCEPRLLAHYAEVKLLIEGYLSDPPIDAHSMVAKAAGIPRQAGKTLNQALITGSGNAAAAAQLNRPLAEAMSIINAYFRAMPEIKTEQRRISDVFISRGYLTSLLGRRARLEDPRFAYRGMNRLLQCGNADILKKSMADIDEYLLSEADDDVNLLNNIHDDLQYQFTPDGRKHYERALEFMQDYGPHGQSVYVVVPMTVDPKTGADWGEATYGRDAVIKAFEAMGGRYG